MASLVVSPEAILDLAEIYYYIADSAGNEHVAERYIDFLQSKFELIAGMPGIGPRRDYLFEGVRIHPVDRYVIFYRENGDTVEIGRVLHGSRNLEAIFAEAAEGE